MVEEFRTCRICGEQSKESRLLKYDVRHYAHYRCLLSRFSTLGEAMQWIETLHGHQIRNFPVLVFADWMKAVTSARTLKAVDVLSAALKKVEERERMANAGN